MFTHISTLTYFSIDKYQEFMMVINLISVKAKHTKEGYQSKTFTNENGKQ